MGGGLAMLQFSWGDLYETRLNHPLFREIS